MSIFASHSKFEAGAGAAAPAGLNMFGTASKTLSALASQDSGITLLPRMTCLSAAASYDDTIAVFGGWDGEAAQTAVDTATTGINAVENTRTRTQFATTAM